MCLPCQICPNSQQNQGPWQPTGSQETTTASSWHLPMLTVVSQKSTWSIEQQLPPTSALLLSNGGLSMRWITQLLGSNTSWTSLARTTIQPNLTTSMDSAGYTRLLPSSLTLRTGIISPGRSLVTTEMVHVYPWPSTRVTMRISWYMMSSLKAWRGGGDTWGSWKLQIGEGSGAWASFWCKNMLFCNHLLNVDARSSSVGGLGRYFDYLSGNMLSKWI